MPACKDRVDGYARSERRQYKGVGNSAIANVVIGDDDRQGNK